MHDDPPPGSIEVLDEYDDDTSRSRRRTRAWLLGPAALLAVAAIVVAVVLGGTAHTPLTVSSSPPVAPPTLSATPPSTGPPTSWATVEASAPSVPSASRSEIRVEVSGASIQVITDEGYLPPPIPSAAEAEPLVVTLLDAKGRTAPGVIAYNVRICVAAGSAAANGRKVDVIRDRWTLDTGMGASNPTPVGAIAPAFPALASLAAGQCASGWVTFQVGADAKSLTLMYGDERFFWSWRIR
jgi:hypothetical protein